MELYLVLRFAKLLAVMLLVSGTVGAVAAEAYADRQRFAYRLAGPGFGLTWLLGFVLVGVRDLPLLSPWMLGSMALSLLSINGVLYIAGRPTRRTWLAGTLTLLPLVLALALMVWRPA